MNTTPQELTVEHRLIFRTTTKGRKQRTADAQAEASPAAVSPGRLPRITRLLALAHRFDHLVQTGQVKDFAELARVGCVTRARLSQIMDLLLMAPDLQEQILRLGGTQVGRDPVTERQMRCVTTITDWNLQRAQWKKCLQNP